MNAKMNKKQVVKEFMNSRHPEMKFSRIAGAWLGGGYGITSAEAEAEAVAEIELVREGVMDTPSWMAAAFHE